MSSECLKEGMQNGTENVHITNRPNKNHNHNHHRKAKVPNDGNIKLALPLLRFD